MSKDWIEWNRIEATSGNDPSRPSLKVVLGIEDGRNLVPHPPIDYCCSSGGFRGLHGACAGVRQRTISQ